MTTLLSDLVVAARALRRSPRFSALSILVLALGIGLNAMLFSVADAVVFRPFPFADAERLVIAGENLITPRSEITYREFKTWREQARTFDDMAAIGSSSWTWHLIGARTVAAGSIAGAAAAAALTPLMRSILFEVAPLDPLILVAAPMMFAAAALAACAVPAVSAARIEPAVCLRAE